MKITILSPIRDWEHIIKDTKPFTDKIGNVNFEVRFFPLYHMPREEYLEGRWGIQREYLSAIARIFAGDVIVLHAPDFKVDGAAGWYDTREGIPFIQIYSDIKSEITRTTEFKYRVAEILIHELCHKLSRKYNIEDRTHYWEYNKLSLMGKIDEIIEKQTNKRDYLLEKAINKAKELLSLRKSQLEQIRTLLTEWALAIQEMEGWYEGSLTYRHNNPGSLRWSKYQTGNVNNFSVFPDYETGFKALLFQLEIAANGKSKVYNPDMTLIDFFKVYAPTSDNNNPINYANFVAKRLGVPADIKIKELI